MVEIKSLIKAIGMVSILFSVGLIIFLFSFGSTVEEGSLRSTLFVNARARLFLALIGAVSFSVILVRE